MSGRQRIYLYQGGHDAGIKRMFVAGETDSGEVMWVRDPLRAHPFTSPRDAISFCDRHDMHNVSLLPESELHR